MALDPFDNIVIASVNDTTLAYQQLGEGEPVVLVHGIASDQRTWKEQLPALGTRFRAIAYSRRFFHPNADKKDGAEDHTLLHVRDLIGLLDALAIDSAHLVGHCSGALVSLLAALNHPNRVRSLVIMEPEAHALFLSSPPRLPELARLFVAHPRMARAITRYLSGGIVPAQKAFRRGDDATAIKQLLRAELGPERSNRLSDERMQQVLDNQEAERTLLLGHASARLRASDFRRVLTPTLLLHAEHSPAMFRHLTRYLHAVLPRSEVVRIPDASHFLHEDNSAAANDVILHHLDRHASPHSG